MGGLRKCNIRGKCQIYHFVGKGEQDFLQYYFLISRFLSDMFIIKFQSFKFKELILLFYYEM
jgi:hypothetical protein